MLLDVMGRKQRTVSSDVSAVPRLSQQPVARAGKRSEPASSAEDACRLCARETMPFNGHHRSSNESHHEQSSSHALNGGAYAAAAARSSDLAGGTSQALPSTMSQQQQYDSPRRAAAFGRQPEELHIPLSGTSMPSHTARQQPHNQFPSSSEPGAGNPPSISIQQSAPQHAQYSSGPSSTLPGALQPGNATNRPPPLPANTASSTAPALPPISTQSQQSTTTPSRPTNSHGHSKSSPAGFDQPKYKQYGTPPDDSKYSSPPGSGYPQTPSGAKYSPLGLADIRPQTDSALVDTPITGSRPFNGDFQIPKNSNYVAPWPIYAVDWCKWPMPSGGSFAGKIQIIDVHRKQPDPDTPDLAPGDVQLEFVKSAEATHSYPVTRILWEPPSSQKQSTDLLATSGDHLRLWSLPSSHAGSNSNSITRPSNQREQQQPAKLSPLALLSNSKSPEHTAPITALDWNTVSPSLIITSSIDTTCTIWDIPTLTAKTQLIAHDKEVYDVRFCANSVDIFVSCGSDGSVRMFDLRSLEHSTIIYEPSEKNDKPSPHDSHLLATFAQDSNIVRILDVRQPGQAIIELRGHSAPINSVEWCPNRRGIIASGADDCLVLVWDLINHHNATHIAPSVHHSSSSSSSSTSERGPFAAWQCDYEVSNMSWSPQGATTASGHPRDWLGVWYGMDLS
ncbi:WD repeat protein [Rasamsonia emersonii CBS 393.64]|uniref:WD repeat protein n=1 Tax=Rasamsonia emersonii (strain ATCC 16479 / CBS 393.64 / IMI 116815) TaxID=1408163 RepID=A0A0F4Z6W5_RASE3|nr:WD repeat protein [Rasamsonia emersonii CBS 393.64]KKA25831.1 WD repeat protein [Rasamsonia emersonii CBS 393.64]